MPRLNRGEYWLLSEAVEFRFPLRTLTLPEGPPWDGPTIDVTLNHEGHGLSLNQLSRTLLRMANLGWIEFSRGIGSDRHLLATPDHARIREWLGETGTFIDGVYYALTAAGGHVWEKFARPDWDRYIAHESDSEDGSVEIVTATEKLLHKYLQAVATEVTIDPESVQIAEIQPWQLTYWKSLPCGVRCTFRGTELPYQPPKSQWWRERWCRWL